jgi:hypothetical protein
MPIFDPFFFPKSAQSNTPLANRAVLDSARAAGIPRAMLVDEGVAVAACFAFRHELPAGGERRWGVSECCWKAQSLAVAVVVVW